ncbi:hypothetical protein TIFTF001_023241 [Ficus carica]|uniref:Uncharacterized protein n=1 Tax=Ficus carica TaxID=3494 RepID=A0AA88AN69_FICCA|nr:hypothetical protein TIFTF001_023241 [Ficus carica]
MSSSQSRRREVTESVVRPDTEKRAVLADKPTILDDDPIIREIDKYPERGGEVDGEDVEDSEATTNELSQQRFYSGKLSIGHRRS